MSVEDLVPVRNPVNGSVALVSEAYAEALVERHDPAWSRVDASEVVEDTGVVLPARSASKAAWVEFAVAHGREQSEVEALTRDELAESYGA